MKQNHRSTSFLFSHLILRLYGHQDYVSVKEYQSLGTAKKTYVKLIQSIRLSIQSTVTLVDNEHRNSLFVALERNEQYIIDSTDFGELDEAMVVLLAEVTFLLIGGLPERSQQETVRNSKQNWILNSHRQIQYLQTAEQKKLSIFGAVQGKYKSRFGDWDRFVHKIYYKECKNDPELLVKWLRVNHHDIYCELF